MKLGRLGNIAARQVAVRPALSLRERTAIVLILTATFLDLAGTKWASYIPTPVPQVYLPDLLLSSGALLAIVGRSRGTRQRSPVAVGLFVTIYVGYRAVEQIASSQAAVWEYWIRDMAPFFYLALVPSLAQALRLVRFEVVVSLVRAASAVLGVTVLAQDLGALSPIDYGGQFPAFQLRPDADGVVLGLGVLAWGRWEALSPRRFAQVGLLLLALGHYSRAGVLAALLCAAIAMYRERALLAPRFGGALLIIGTIGASVGLVGVLPALAAEPGVLPEALSRLVATDLDTGSTGARTKAWTLVLHHVHGQSLWLFGAGPGRAPLADSGALRFLSGSEDVRAAHNWFVSAIAYHGILGLSIWAAAIWAVVKLGFRSGRHKVLPVTGILAYLICGSFGVIVESPFGSLPISVFSALIIAGSPQLGTKTCQT